MYVHILYVQQCQVSFLLRLIISKVENKILNFIKACTLHCRKHIGKIAKINDYYTAQYYI